MPICALRLSHDMFMSFVLVIAIHLLLKCAFEQPAEISRKTIEIQKKRNYQIWCILATFELIQLSKFIWFGFSNGFNKQISKLSIYRIKKKNQINNLFRFCMRLRMDILHKKRRDICRTRENQSHKRIGRCAAATMKISRNPRSIWELNMTSVLSLVSKRNVSD